MDLHRLNDAKAKHEKLLTEINLIKEFLGQFESFSLQRLEEFQALSPNKRLKAFGEYSKLQDQLLQCTTKTNCDLESFIVNDMTENNASSMWFTNVSTRESKITEDDVSKSTEMCVSSINNAIDDATMEDKNEKSVCSIAKLIPAPVPFIRNEPELREMEVPLVNSICRISFVEDIGKFYINVAGPDSEQIDTMASELNEHYDKTTTEFVTKKRGKKNIHTYCATYIFQWSTWYRVKILRWKSQKYNTVTVRAVDYGHEYETKLEKIRVLDEKFRTVPIAAQKCHFSFLYPPGSTRTKTITEWPERTKETFLNLIKPHSFFLIAFAKKEGDSVAIDLIPYVEGNLSGDVTVGAQLIASKCCVELLPLCPSDAIKVDCIKEQIRNAQDFRVNADDVSTLDDDFNVEEDNVNVAVTGYDARDEAVTCKNLRPDGTCFKGSRCNYSHVLTRQDGYTIDKVPVYNDAFSPLTLPKAGETVEVIITNICNIHTFYIHITNNNGSKKPRRKLNQLIASINEQKSLKSLKTFKQPPSLGQIVLAKHWNTEWLRGRVISLILPDEEQEASAVIYFVDYGDEYTVELRNLRQIEERFLFLPFQAVLCHLNKVGRTVDCNETDDCLFMEKNFLGQHLKADVVYSGTILQVDLITKNNEDVGQKIIEAGRGVPISEIYPNDKETFLVD